MTKILLVDDEPPIVSFLEHLFADSGYQTLSAFDGITALREFFAGRPDAAIIDLKMPHMDGLELCRRIREISNIPIIVLTGLGQVGEKVNAFNAGADDHVVKPASGRELVARVEACLRRGQWPLTVESRSPYTDPHLTLDFIRREVFVDGESKDLTPIEYSLLVLFVRRPGEALSLEFLLSNAWGPGYDTFDLVKWHISNLRKKLENKAGKMPAIVTVRGFGYRYEPFSSNW
ncbi:MAG TPA: response regulator transcription factor [Dehalococcoidia bacterium]|nr:response regulator transcription factor [Dehalococcoidia bacterium]